MLKPEMRLVLVLVMTGSAIGLFAAGTSEPLDPADLVGELVFQQGSVQVNGVSGEVGQEIRPGDQISTGRDSLCEVTFGARNIIQFRENTETIIEPAWAGVSMKRGTVAAVLNGLERLGFSDSNRFEIRTTTAVMAVRGTAFFVDNRDSDEAYFCTCNGRLHIESLDGEYPEDTEAYHHDAVWYVRTTDGVRKFPSGLHYHDDDDLNSIARKALTVVRWRD